MGACRRDKLGVERHVQQPLRQVPVLARLHEPDEQARVDRVVERREAVVEQGFVAALACLVLLIILLCCCCCGNGCL